MWKAISTVLTSSNALLSISFIVVLIILISILAKLGVFSLHVRGIRIGGDEDERAIIRRQIEWTELQIQAMANESIFEGFDTYRTKYIMERVFDEIISWIIFNHISDDIGYISIKQEKVWALIQTLIANDRFTQDDFKEMIYSRTELVIKRLIQIRRSYHIIRR